MERKLAAILAADVAGYSRLMGQHEERTLTALRADRKIWTGLQHVWQAFVLLVPEASRSL